MGKIKKIIMLLTIVFFCTACVDFNAGKRPYDYNSGKWVSDYPEAWFNTNITYENQPLNMPVGEITMDGEQIPFVMLFDTGNMGALCKYDINNTTFDYSFEDAFIEGTCTFSESELRIIITTAKDLDYNEIIFVKSDSTTHGTSVSE